jgi:hypothetical protein
VAGRLLGDPDRWRPTGHVYVTNTGTTTLDAIMVVVTYGGPGAPVGAADSIDVSIAPGKTKAIVIPEHRLLSFPIAQTITATVYFGQAVPYAVATRDLVEYQHNNAPGTLPFPCKYSDLEDNEYFATGTNHGYGSNHGNTASQRFAYDIHARRWTGSSWSSLHPETDGSLPEDYLCWGKPVYAVANAKILAGYRLREDGAIDEDLSPGGNGFWMQLDDPDPVNGHFMLYAHLMKESIPEELVPVEGGPGPVVTKGQFLGLIGKSGTKKPHLHFHIQRGISKYVAGAVEGNDQGVPFSFENVWLREWSGYDPDEDTGSGWHLCDGVGIGENMLVYPTGPEYAGPIQVGPWDNDGFGLKDPQRDFGERATFGQLGVASR